MTIVSTFYDALLTKIAATWTTAKQVPDALNLEGAPSIILQDGYALAVGPATGSDKDQSCQERFTREVMIIRTLVIAAADTDAAKMTTVIKTLLESHYDLRAALRNDNTLGGVIADMNYVSDGGVELLPTAGGRFHVMSSVYSVTYIENLY